MSSKPVVLSEWKLVDDGGVGEVKVELRGGVWGRDSVQPCSSCGLFSTGYQWGVIGGMFFNGVCKQGPSCVLHQVCVIPKWR